MNDLVVKALGGIQSVQPMLGCVGAHKLLGGHTGPINIDNVISHVLCQINLQILSQTVQYFT